MTPSTIKPVRLSKLQKLCINYQYRLALNKKRASTVTRKEAILIVEEINQTFNIPTLDETRVVRLLAELNLQETVRG